MLLPIPVQAISPYLRTGASPLFAKPEMGSVRFRVHKMRRRPWPSVARVRPASVPARTPRGTRTPTMTGRRVAWLGLSSPPALTHRTPMKRTALRLRGGRRSPLVAYAPSLSCAPPLNNTRLRCARVSSKVCIRSYPETRSGNRITNWLRAVVQSRIGQVHRLATRLRAR